MASALIINDVPIECINRAAITYNVPAKLIVSILLTEQGRVGSATPNSNGTFDYGPMQINTIWLNKVRQYGYTKDDLQYNPCVNVWVGTWILSQKLADFAYSGLGFGVGSYNSVTPKYNRRYSHKVSDIYGLLQRYLSSPMPLATSTNNVYQPQPQPLQQPQPAQTQTFFNGYRYQTPTVE
jgi:hypothetical protein